MGENTFKLLKSQREYKWQKDEITLFVEDLWNYFLYYNDLDDEEKEEKNFLIGCIYTIWDDEYLSIIDGQQRTISLLIIIKVISEKFLYENEKEKYSKYYIRKFISNDKDRRDGELKYYDISFGQKDNYDQIRKCRHASNICDNICLLEKYINDLVKENASIIDNKISFLRKFLEFIIEKIQLINIVFTDNNLAFDTFVKVNHRGKDLTDIELLHSFIWTLTNVSDSSKDKFSDKYKECCELYFNKGKQFYNPKKMITKEADLLEGFMSAYRCYVNPKDYKPNNMFNIISKKINKNPEFLDEINNDWFKYIESFAYVVNDINSKFCRTRTMLKNIKRKEYIPILGYIYLNDVNISEKTSNNLVNMIKLISLVSWLNFEYQKENNDDKNKFDSNSLIFDEVFKYVKNAINEDKLTKEDISNFITENFLTIFNNVNCYLEEELPFIKKNTEKALNELIDLWNEYIIDFDY